MLITKNVSFKYPKQEEQYFPDINLKSGGSLLITGASGKGKSTLLYLLSGLLKPSHGDITFNNISIPSLSENERDHLRGTQMGIVFQNTSFIQSLSVFENVQLSGWLANKKKIRKDEIMYFLSYLGIDDIAHKSPEKLSTGQRQRVSIARALVHQPALLLADEPTASLDDINTDKVAKLLLDCTLSFNTSLVVVTHDQRLKQFFSSQIKL